MASYPNSLARFTAPQMSQSKGQPKAFSGKQNGMKNAAARRLGKSKRPGKMAMNKGSY
jgi:hypothetical protein